MYACMYISYLSTVKSDLEACVLKLSRRSAQKKCQCILYLWEITTEPGDSFFITIIPCKSPIINHKVIPFITSQLMLRHGTLQKIKTPDAGNQCYNLAFINSPTESTPLHTKTIKHNHPLH